MPRLIILTYGSAINGLSATIFHIISILNLIQAGAVGASILAMYKPVAEENYNQISIILNSSKIYFSRLGYIFLFLILTLSPFVAFYKSDFNISKLEIFLSMLILGINASYSFFFTSWYDILFSSHQKRYILTNTSIIEKLVYYILLFCILHFKIHFIIMYVAILLCSTIRTLFLFVIYKKTYSIKLFNVLKNNNYLIPNRGYLLASQISSHAVLSSPILIVSFSFDLKTASVFSIYAMIQSAINMIINTIQLSVSPVFGNLVVSSNSEKIQEIFNVIQFVFIVLGMLLCTCMAYLYMPFISIYTEGFTDANYKHPLLAFLFVLAVLVFCLSLPFALFINVYGFYKETYKKDIIFSLISILFSILLTNKFGMPYASVCLILYPLLTFIYRIFIIKNKISWFKLKNFLYVFFSSLFFQ